MFKKIVTSFLLMLYLSFSSGVVVFAFECECAIFKHTHFSLLKNVDCSDFYDEVAHQNSCGCCENCHNDDFQNCNEKKFDNEIEQDKIKQNSQLYLKQLIKAKSGTYSIKVFQLGIDTIKTFVPLFKFIPELSKFSQIDLLLLKTAYNFINSKFNNISTKHLENIPDIPRLLIVSYIHTITNLQNTNEDDLLSSILQ
jgi:hypothetical protein